jgi:hypothetical protein
MCEYCNLQKRKKLYVKRNLELFFINYILPISKNLKGILYIYIYMPRNRKNSSRLVQVVGISLSKEVHTPEPALRHYEDLVIFCPSK